MSEASASAPAPAGPISTRPPLGITHFNFEHRVFKTPGARFLLKGHEKLPIFRVDMGDLQGVIDIDDLRSEFGIHPSSIDAKLIDMAVEGLRYVPDIKPGDTIPTEILTGEASWSVSPKHKRIAEQRLQVQLLSWVSGKEILLTDPSEISMFLEQIENREKLRTAFSNASKALGHESGDPEPVIKLLELLARELCYIEALRDRYSQIPKIGAKMLELAKSYGNDRNAKMELNRVHALLLRGIEEYTAIFNEADAQTGEIVAAMKSLERQVGYIRKIRDDLHFLCMDWDPHIAGLDRWQTRRTAETDKLLSALYRFLAPRFTSGKSLLKHRGLQAPGADGGQDRSGATKK